MQKSKKQKAIPRMHAYMHVYIYIIPRMQKSKKQKAIPRMHACMFIYILFPAYKKSKKQKAKSKKAIPRIHACLCIYIIPTYIIFTDPRCLP